MKIRLPSQCNVSKKWWSIKDQDEWTNSLSLGSNPGHKAVSDTDTSPDYGTRIESRYRTQVSGPEV